MNSVIMGFCAGFWALILCSGCGGSSSDSAASCSNSAACGGDITGEWTVTSSCVSVSDVSMVNQQCPSATANAAGLKVTGNVTYNADLTFTSTSTISGSTSVTLPASCLSVQGITVSCAQLTQAFMTLAQQGSSGFKSASCSSAGSGCTCNVVLNDQTTSQSGTYSTTSDGVLTETPLNGAAGQSDYCVKGSTLTVSPSQSVNMGAMGQMGITGTVVFAKQ